MKLEHVSVWTGNLEALKNYYTTHFGAISNELYQNPATGFCSYFLSFENGARLEIMSRADIPDNLNDTVTLQHKGIIHIAFELETREAVDEKARLLALAGYPILRGPRVTGDGYYEFETLDPDSNRLEVITRAI